LFQTTYNVSAFATAEEYNLESLTKEAKNYGYTVIQLPEGDGLFLSLLGHFSGLFYVLLSFLSKWFLRHLL